MHKSWFRHSASKLSIDIIALLLLIGASTTRGAVVTSCDEASLRAAMDAGGTVTFACDGTIVLANAIVVPVDVALDGTGRNVRISGNDAVRLFHVSPRLDFSVTGVALVNGRTNHGAAIFNDGGNVSLVNCALLNNSAVGASAQSSSDEANASGGAILNRTGRVAAVSCVFSNNQARGSGSVPLGLRGGLGNGGAIINDGGDVVVTNCHFVMNSAIGGQGGGEFIIVTGAGGSASGGAVHSRGGVVQVAHSLFGNNNAFGGGGGVGFGRRGNGGGASGGAIYLADGGLLGVFGTRFATNGAHGGSGDGGTSGGAGGTVLGGAVALENSRTDATGCDFTGNLAFGGLGGRTQRGGNASGGAVSCRVGVANLTDCVVSGNQAAAGAGNPEGVPGADAFGAGLYHNGTSIVTRVHFIANSATGGFGGGRPTSVKGGAANGGAFYSEGVLTVRESALAYNMVVGAPGGIKEAGTGVYPGGDGSAGGAYNAGELHLVNTTLAENRALGGPGVTFGSSSAPPGTPFGGAIFNAGPANVFSSTIARNSGLGSCVYATASITFLNSIVALSTNGENCVGTIGDAGYNISDSGCFGHPTSRNNVDPRLGPLADNGGPTPTMALLVNSPAVDAANESGAPAIDQRGASRPQGAHADIGAFEARPAELRSHLGIARASFNDVDIRLLGRITKSYALEASSSLSTWTSIATNVTDGNGGTVFTQPSSNSRQFYRAREL